MKHRLFVAALPVGAGAFAQNCELKIGSMGPMSGGAAQSGLAMNSAAELAAAEVNQEGGVKIGGKTCKVVVVPYDGKYTADGAAAGSNVLAAQDIKRIIGPVGSPAATGIKPVGARNEAGLLERGVRQERVGNKISVGVPYRTGAGRPGGRGDQTCDEGVPNEVGRAFATRSVTDNVLTGAFGPGRTRQTEASDWLRSVFSLLTERANQPAGQLSGGQQQIVALSRAMASFSKLLLMDEPFPGLAPVWIKQISDAILQLRARGTTVLMTEQTARRGTIPHSPPSGTSIWRPAMPVYKLVADRKQRTCPG